MYEDQKEAIRYKAKQKRYKRPAHKDLNLEAIQYSLSDIQEACAAVEYCFEGDDPYLFCELVGGEDQFHEFKIMFSDLEADCDQMLEDLNNEWIPKMFDTFFAAISDKSQSLCGWDTYERDYFGLTNSYEVEWAIKEGKDKIMRMTKSDLIECASRCFVIAINYLSLRSRYEDLQASIDIIRNTNKAEFEVLKNINEVYEKAEKESNGFERQWCKEMLTYNRLLNSIDPSSRIWLQ